MAVPSVLIVGGGISGFAAAKSLAEAGVSCTIVDRGKRLGGRMAVRTLRDPGSRWDGRPVDIGASYFTVRDPAFASLVAHWETLGLARPWTDSLGVAGPSGLTGLSSGQMRWSAPAGLRSLVEHMASSLDSDSVHHPREVAEVSWRDGQPWADGEPYDLVLLCGPDPQMLRLLSGDATDPITAVLSDSKWEPVLALTAVYDKRHWPHITGIFVNDSDVLGFVADDGSRRGDDAPVLVAHAASHFAAQHLADPAAAGPAMVEATHRVLGISAEPLHTHVQRWSLARPLAGRDEPHLLNERLGIGLAGDSWHGGPRVEAAWLSGTSLGRAAATRLLSG